MKTRTAMKPSLLIDEPPLQVLPSLVLAIGLEEAIVLQQLNYWLNNPNTDGRVDENGDKWVFNSYESWQKTNFPFWSTDKIKKIFLNLEKLGVVISAQLDAAKRDMTKFYRIDYDKLSTTHECNSAPSISSNSHYVNKELTETTTETTTTTITREDEISEISRTYESEIGLLTGMIRDKLIMALDEYPKDWIIKALEQSALNNKRNWAYAEAILKRWKVDGFQADTRQKTSGNSRSYMSEKDRYNNPNRYSGNHPNEIVIREDDDDDEYV